MKRKIIKLEWSNAMTAEQMLSNDDVVWSDDNDETIQFASKTAVVGAYSQFAGLAFFGTYGGYGFGSADGDVNVQTIDGVKGIGFEAWVVFDRQGNGVVFS